MAGVFVSEKCPICKKPVVDEGYLLSKVKLTKKEAYGIYTKKTVVRPNFVPNGNRFVFHEECITDLLS